MINSHIQMPKCVLKQFEDGEHFVYFWDLQKDLILNRHAKSINTELGYYSEAVEKYLRDNIETPLGLILHFINSIDPQCPAFEMGEDKKDILRRFVYALAARNPRMLELIKKGSIYAQLFNPTERQQHDRTVYMGIEIAKKQQLFGDWEITFMENHTEVPFILPICGMYSYKYAGDEMFNIPLTPRYAITFMHSSVVHKYMIDGAMRLFQLVTPEQAMEFNLRALQAEKKTGGYGVAANSKKLLEKMRMVADN